MIHTQNKIIIITAPSGAGKSTITHYLLNKYPSLSFSISAATRSPRGKFRKKHFWNGRWYMKGNIMVHLNLN
jgi:guanylate kinase